MTLTGPGGCGKTRLALAVAARLQAIGMDIWFVPLADLVPGTSLDQAAPGAGAAPVAFPPGRIADRVLDALLMPRSAGIAPLEQVIAFFSHRSRDGSTGLLVLDNIEHVVEEGAPLIHALLQRLPGLTCLVTSRRRLGLEGEQELPVPPLPVPDAPRCATPEALAQCPSVALFLDRARAVRPDFQLTGGNAAAVAALCARLEGLPLALELAAARVGVLTPAQMLERLSSAPAPVAGARFELLATRQRGVTARHRSLRAALEWSYQLLPPELQRFFARLSIFRGGLTLEAAGAVCADCGIGDKDKAGEVEACSARPPIRSPQSAIHNPLGCLEELRERSLLLAEETGVRGWRFQSPSPPQIRAIRFRLLETLREFGAEQLSAEEHAAAARRHAAYYLALAEQAEPQLKGREQEAWFGRLDAEIDNLRAALDWSQSAAGDREWGLRLAGSLGRFWLVRGYWAEGLERLQALLAGESGVRRRRGQPGAGRPSLARAKAQMWACDLSHLRGDQAAARTFAMESLASARALGDRRSIASALNNLADVALARSDLQDAHSLATQSLAIWRELGEPWGAALSLLLLATVARDQGDLPSTRARAAESLAIWRELGDLRGIAMALVRLGDAVDKQGEGETARGFLEEGLAIYQGLGDPWGACITRLHLGESSRRLGDFAVARAHFEESLAISRQVNYPSVIALALLYLGELARARGDASAARGLLDESLAIFRKAGYKPGTATCLIWMAWLAQDQGDVKQAMRLFGAADAAYTPADALLGPEDRRENDARRAALRTTLGETRGVQ